MILDRLENGETYGALHPLIAYFFSHYTQEMLSELSEGITELLPGISITRSQNRLTSALERKLEMHKTYLDIHIPLSAVERIGYAGGQSLQEVLNPYNEAKDIAFYGDDYDQIIPVKPGEFLLLYPQEAHAPLIGEGELDKLIVKIKR